MVIRSRLGGLLFLFLLGIGTMSMFLVPAYFMGIFEKGQVRYGVYNKTMVRGFPTQGEYFKTGKSILLMQEEMQKEAQEKNTKDKCIPAAILLDDPHNIIKSMRRSIGGCIDFAYESAHNDSIEQNWKKGNPITYEFKGGKGFEVSFHTHPIFAFRKAIPFIQEQQKQLGIKNAYPVFYFFQNGNHVFRIIYDVSIQR